MPNKTPGPTGAHTLQDKETIMRAGAGKTIPVPHMYSLPIQAPQLATPHGSDGVSNRAQLLRDIESGELDHIEFDALVFRHGKNRNHYTFRLEDLPALAPSFQQKPFLRNHNTHDIGARDGIIVSSKLEGDEIHQTIRLTTRQGMTDYVEGRIDRFSIGWNFDWIMCTVCDSDWLNCNHWPGREYQTEQEKVTCELCFMEPSGKETSAVNANAVDGTGLLAALESYKGQILGGTTMPQQQEISALEQANKPAAAPATPPNHGGATPSDRGGATSQSARSGANPRRGTDPAVTAAEAALEAAEARLAEQEPPKRTGEDEAIARQMRAVENLLGAERNVAALEHNVDRSNKMLLQISARLLAASLAASKLPAPAQERIRKSFQARLDSGVGFEPTELEDEIVGMRSMLGDVMSSAMIQGPARVNAMYNTDDAVLAAAADMFRIPREPGLENVRPARLSGIRELYHMLTGDYGMHGGFYPDEVGLATTLDFTGLVKNSLNKLVVQGWEQMGVSGYSWWEKIVAVEPFNTLQQVTGTLIGTISTMPTVDEEGEYQPFTVGDSPETGDWLKYGGYVPLTIELIDRDETRKVIAYGIELGKASRRNISEQVAGIFTSNSHAGPLMADTGALFNATAIAAAGGHLNLLATALGADYTAWDAAAAAMYNQPMFTHKDTPSTGKKLAVDPKYCLVPRALRAQANSLFLPRWSSNVESIASAGGPDYAGIVEPVTVPEWTDATNWAAVADPMIAPAIFVGHRFGLKPEIFVAGRDTDPAVFMNDEHRIKVRHFLAIWVNDYRPLHKNNVAG